jgi:hypothetical protein
MSARTQHSFRESVKEARARYSLKKEWQGTDRVNSTSAREGARRLSHTSN